MIKTTEEYLILNLFKKRNKDTKNISNSTQLTFTCSKSTIKTIKGVKCEMCSKLTIKTPERRH